VEGRDYVTPDDIKHLAVPVFAHRIICGGVVREGQRHRARQVILQILDRTRVPT